MGLTQTVAPTIDPVTVAETKLHMRVDISDDDTLITNMITAATRLAEALTRRQIITATWQLTLDGFPDEIVLPRPDLISVTSVQYVDTGGLTQTLATSEYTVLTDGAFGKIVEAYEKTWPDIRDIPNAVTVTYTSGYGAATTDVPESVRLAIKTMVADMYEHRMSRDELKVSDNPVVQNLLDSQKVPYFV